MSDNISMTPEQLSALIAQAVKTAVEETKKTEPGIIANIYFGTKAMGRSVVEKTKELTDKLKEEAAIEIEMSAKRKEMEEVLNQFAKAKKNK